MTEHTESAPVILDSNRSSYHTLKVVHFVSTWLPQASAWLYHQVSSLPTDKVANYIVCNETWGLDQFPHHNICSLETVSPWRRRLRRIKTKLHWNSSVAQHLPLLEQAFRDIKPDILHSHYGHMGWVNAPLAKKYGLKHVVSFYGADVNYIPRKDHRWRARYREMGAAVDRILCEGPFMADSIASFGIPREKISLQRLGVNLAKLRFEPRRYRDGMPLRFLIIASFREKKGIPYALEALARFKRISNKFELTVIGDAHLERERAEKEKILHTLKATDLAAYVRFLGFQPYDKVLYEAYRHHIFLAPSVTAQDGDCEGGAPVSIIEMAATGMPVVSTTHCDIPFVVSKDNSPYLVSERDSVGLCDAIVRLLSSDWTGLLQSNRKFIEQELDTRRQGEKLCHIYRDLL